LSENNRNTEGKLKEIIRWAVSEICREFKDFLIIHLFGVKHIGELKEVMSSNSLI
jgi:hypothetical protein